MNEANAARDEGVVRRVNEAIEDGLWPEEREDLVRMKCECGRFDCNVFLSIRVAEYERIRANPRRFFISPGHERGDDIEKVVDRLHGYVIVEKVGEAGERAEELDPRDGGAS